MKHAISISVLLALHFVSLGQSNFSSDSLLGWWLPDTNLRRLDIGDTVTFRHSNLFIAFGTEFYEQGNYQTVRKWAWCGSRSWWEKILGLNKTKYRNGKWSLQEINNSKYITMKDRKNGFIKLEVHSLDGDILTLVKVKK